MEFERELLIETLNSYKKHLENVRIQILRTQRISKHSGRSEEARKDGNALFYLISQNNYDAETCIQIFNHYNRSISLAPFNSEELALAYGNRSAFLLRLAKYQECIKDIDRALEITKSALLKAKLYCRKVECLKKLGSSDYKGALKKAEAYCNKVDGKNKESIVELVDKVKTCSIYNEKSVNKQTQNVEVFPVTDNFSDRIAIRHNEKYGRYLIAAKNYEPGDIIFVEKLFATVLNEKMNYTNCNYCLKICWTGIACDYCSWAMFCSEDCKKMAWDNFHNIECSVISVLKNQFFNIFVCVKVSLRMLLTGIKEAGSIDNLKEYFKSVDECTDVHSQAFYVNGNFSSNSIKSVYLLKSGCFDDFKKQEECALAIGIVLITLIEYSQLLPHFNMNKIEDLIQNNDILFIGSLLMKLLTITSNNSHSFSHEDCDCENLKDFKSNINVCCKRGSCIAPVASLINHSCFCNASTCFTEDRKVIIYAIQPIKKGYQVFNSYVGYYFNSTFESRQERLKKYNFKCDCLACTELWPPLLTLSEFELQMNNYCMKSVFEKKLYNDCINIFKALDYKTYNFKKKDVKILRNAITQSIKQLKQPSLLTSILIAAHGKVFSHMYALKSPKQSFDLTKNV